MARMISMGLLSRASRFVIGSSLGDIRICFILGYAADLYPVWSKSRHCTPSATLLTRVGLGAFSQFYHDRFTRVDDRFRTWRTILIFTMLSVLLTIGFSFIFIFGKLGFPALGIAGSGLGDYGQLQRHGDPPGKFCVAEFAVSWLFSAGVIVSIQVACIFAVGGAVESGAAHRSDVLSGSGFFLSR